MEALVRYDFRIDVWTPETLPMARLADYLAQLAVLFGHREYVHFMQVRKGSAVPEIAVNHEAAPKVAARLRLVGGADAPPEAVRAQQEINDMLRDDNASAVLRRKRGATVLAFPGCKTPLAEEAVVHEQGELDGVIIRIGGKDETVPVWIEGEHKTIYKCSATRQLARELRGLLFDQPIRVAGRGKWRRGSNRQWALEQFEIKSFEVLEEVSLADSIAQLRAIKGSHWNEMPDPQRELRKLRVD